jgi:hypothetical protein
MSLVPPSLHRLFRDHLRNRWFDRLGRFLAREHRIGNTVHWFVLATPWTLSLVLPLKIELKSGVKK